jgi:hypothetical protein
MLLVRQLGKQNMAAAAKVMRTIPAAVPALLDAMLGSEAEQQAAALQDEARQLAEQRPGLQAIVLGLAGSRKSAATGLFAGPCSASSDDCSQGRRTAGAADVASTGAVSVQQLVDVSAAVEKADDAGCVSVDGSHCSPGIKVGHFNQRKRSSKVGG